jgi:hypothetical protein
MPPLGRLKPLQRSLHLADRWQGSKAWKKGSKARFDVQSSGMARTLAELEKEVEESFEVCNTAFE